MKRLDRAAVEGCDQDKRAAFQQIFGQILQSMNAFMALPVETMDENAIREATRKVGEMPV